MSEQNVPDEDGRKVHPPVASTDTAVEYITSALTDGKLLMKDACKELGWSFPRIRSRALTVAKKLNSTFTKVSRGVYILEPLETAVSKTLESTPEITDENPTTAESAVVENDATIVDDPTDNLTEEDEPTLDPAKVEAALLGDGTDTPNVQ